MAKPGHKGTIADRYEKLDRTGRRCIGSDLRCERTAAFILTVVPVDPVTGADRGEPEEHKVCPRHRKFYTDDIRCGYRTVNVQELPPVRAYDGLRRAHAEQEQARSRRQD